MRRAWETLRQSEFRSATLYSTLQPCGMCTMASIWAKIARIVYGAERDQVHPMYFEDRQLGTMDFVRDAFRDDLSMSGALLGDECTALYIGPDEDVPKDEQYKTGEWRARREAGRGGLALLAICHRPFSSRQSRPAGAHRCQTPYINL
jgi:hypothetical protein